MTSSCGHWSWLQFVPVWSCTSRFRPAQAWEGAVRTPQRSESAAVVLGADVPFCLSGGRARVGGIGEVVEPLVYEERTFTLFTPPVHCSTVEVYRRWDELGGPGGEHGNDLEPAALDLLPELARWREQFADATGQWPRLAGSGSTWWVEGAHPASAHVVARTTPPMV
jgi:4-diphosphocytidyl-2-C-methyl-D-erythritol kinase